ncbi:MAG: OmpA family protein [Proteobacteria bacterium]|nr:OmpA family protein [Pseudomonadota bacterium]
MATDDDEVPQAQPGSLAWMLTFADLISLCLVFFVMLFAMSKMKVDEYAEVVDSMSRTFAPTTQTDAAPAAQFNIGTTDTQPAANLDYMFAVIEQKLVQDPVLNLSTLTRLDDRLVISLPTDLLFAPASVRVDDRARNALFILAGILRNIPNLVAIYGNTDPQPVTGRGFSSNWELSLVRATSVANEMHRAGYTRRVLTFGAADALFELITTRLPRERRLDLARRVDVVILDKTGEG